MAGCVYEDAESVGARDGANNANYQDTDAHGAGGAAQPTYEEVAPGWDRAASAVVQGAADGNAHTKNARISDRDWADNPLYEGGAP